MSREMDRNNNLAEYTAFCVGVGVGSQIWVGTQIWVGQGVPLEPQNPYPGGT